MWDAKHTSPSGPDRLDALAWLDAYERHGGRVICDGRMFVVTPPSEDIGLPPPPDLMVVAWLAYARERRRAGLSEPELLTPDQF